MRRVLLMFVGMSCAVAWFATPAWASNASVAKTLVVTKADVGSGYKASAASPDTQGFEKIAACVGKPVTGRVVSATKQGSELTDKTGAFIDSSVDIVKTSAMATADRAVVTDPKFTSCVAQLAQSQGATGVSTQTVTVKSYGDFSTAFATHFTVTTNGQSQTVSGVQVFIQKGRADIEVSFVNAGTQLVDQAKAQKILDKLNTRLKNAKVS